MSLLFVFNESTKQRYYRAIPRLAAALAGGYYMDNTVFELYSDTPGELEKVDRVKLEKVIRAHSKPWRFKEPPIMNPDYHRTGYTPEQAAWRKRHDAAEKVYLKELVSKLEACIEV